MEPQNLLSIAVMPIHKISLTRKCSRRRHVEHLEYLKTLGGWGSAEDCTGELRPPIWWKRRLLPLSETLCPVRPFKWANPKYATDQIPYSSLQDLLERASLHTLTKHKITKWTHCLLGERLIKLTVVCTVPSSC